MASEGPLAPSSGSNVDKGSAAWSNPGNVTADDSSFATVSLFAGFSSDYLVIEWTSFSIPSGATIDGVEFAVKVRRASGEVISASNVFLVVAGDVHNGSPGRGTGDDFTTTENTMMFGGAADTWDEETFYTALTDDDINTGIGIAISVNCGGFKGSGEGQVQYATCTVYYTAGGGGGASIPVFMNHYRQQGICG